MTLTVGVRKAIVDKFKLTRKSPLQDRLQVLTQLGTIGATGPGAASEQILNFLVNKVKGANRGRNLSSFTLAATELPPALMNNVDRCLRAFAAVSRNHRGKPVRAMS